MSGSHHPAPASSWPPRLDIHQVDPGEAAWGERSALFELGAARACEPPPPPAEHGELDPKLDQDDVGQLFSEYRYYVAKIGRRILGTGSDVDDLIQDVFLTTVKDVHKIKDPARLRAWLGTVTTRMAKRRRFRRASQPVSNHDDLDELADLANEDGPGPESTADLSGNIQKVLSLPDELRTPWMLKHVEGCTLQDVAKRCECSLSTAARRIQTASGRISRRR
jgi:RNA polymerase sigma-70 factor (ECF subfamily)